MHLYNQKKILKSELFQTAIGLLSWGVLYISLLSIVLISTISVFNWPVQGRFGVVQSGSMEPSIPIGSLLWLSARASYTQSDVIAFIHPDSDTSQTNKTTDDQNKLKNSLSAKKSKIIALHRIIQENEDHFVTKGDANGTIDPWKVKKTDVIGAVQFQIPYLGFLISWLQTQTGIVVSVVLPLTVLLTHSIRSIYESKVQKKP